MGFLDILARALWYSLKPSGNFGELGRHWVILNSDFNLDAVFCIAAWMPGWYLAGPWTLQAGVGPTEGLHTVYHTYAGDQTNSCRTLADKRANNSSPFETDQSVHCLEWIMQLSSKDSSFVSFFPPGNLPQLHPSVELLSQSKSNPRSKEQTQVLVY